MSMNAAIRELRHVLGAQRVIADPLTLHAYSFDSQPVHASADAMVHVRSIEDVAAVCRIAAAYGVPVTARGAGSGMTGGAIAEQGGLLLNMEGMNRVLRIDPADRIAYLEPGVITATLQERAASFGLYYPPEPASSRFSTIGGNIAESAGGLACVKYGLTKHYVAGLRWVDASGDLVETGVYSTHSDGVFDTGAALIGSEGTLGIVVEAAMRLIPLPEARYTIMAASPDMRSALKVSNAVLRSGADPSVLEFMDKRCIETVREYAGVTVDPAAGGVIIAEINGSQDDVAAGRPILDTVIAHSAPLEYRTAETNHERESLWKLRTSLSPALARIAPLKFNEDVSMPLSRIGDIIDVADEIGRRLDVFVVAFGHSGDGNLHINFMTHWDRPDEVNRVKQGLEELFKATVDMGGALSGEHGIGISKRPYISLELNEPSMRFEKALKHAFDPSGMFNPGKIF